jgi:hypothetical protein
MAKAEVANVAFFEVVLTAPVPNVAVLSLKVTVPLTNPPNAGAMAAVNVTGFPFVEGFSEEVMVVVVLALFTVCFSAADVLVLRLTFPP